MHGNIEYIHTIYVCIYVYIMYILKRGNGVWKLGPTDDGWKNKIK